VWIEELEEQHWPPLAERDPQCPRLQISLKSSPRYHYLNFHAAAVKRELCHNASGVSPDSGWPPREHTRAPANTVDAQVVGA